MRRSAWSESPNESVSASSTGVSQQDLSAKLSLAELKSTGLSRSRFRQISPTSDQQALSNRLIKNAEPNFTEPSLAEPNLAEFHSTILPLLETHCIYCHDADTAGGNVEIDSLDPNLISGSDTDWWAEVFSVVTKGEMPPPDESDLEEDERQQLVDWLSDELHTASVVRRFSGDRSAFRRMTRYEYNYALQDLLGLPWDFAKDLPPESHSEQGFQNSSDLLNLSVSQFETYQRIARQALRRATVTGPQPPTRYWGIAMSDAADREWAKQDEEIRKLQEELNDNPDKLSEALADLKQKHAKVPRNAYYKEFGSGRVAEARWAYHRARYAFAPSDTPTAMPDDFDCVAVLPNGRGPTLITELGNQLPTEGTMHVTVRASRTDTRADQRQADQSSDRVPSLQLYFGWRASNEGRALLRVSDRDTLITASANGPQIVSWDVPLGEIYPRNSVRETSPMGQTPSPSEYIRFVNSSLSPTKIQIDYVQVAAPVYEQWPPESHQRIFGVADDDATEIVRAEKIIESFMPKAWRRPVESSEVDRKLELFQAMRPHCESFEDAIVETLATVLSSPQFLFIAASPAQTLTDQSTARKKPTTEDTKKSFETDADCYKLANRLSLFLWCSIPDQELLSLARAGDLSKPEVLRSQVDRMLNDPRSERFVEHFVDQWLNLELLEFQNFKQNVRGFDPLLKQAMQHEPVALFQHILRENSSVLDFIHCDYVIVNERLAWHYGIPGVRGNHFRLVHLSDEARRGGLLTQAGMLAMNSDYPDSHPLKRAIWLLESLLDDPPPPPPPAVPQIDLANPEIAKMTLKERIEDHRNHAACMSCHVKIDPWGIAFENYDALGKWREDIKGRPVDASSELFNHQTLDGMNGLKRFLLDQRQDQFAQAMVSKLATYALGRPLTFGDRAQIDSVAAAVRNNGDGLRTAIEKIVLSDVFLSD